MFSSKNAFRKIEEEKEWVAQSGETVLSAPGLEAEKQRKPTTTNSDRRMAFLHGFEKPSKKNFEQDESLGLAEKILVLPDSREKDLLVAKSFVGQGAHEAHVGVSDAQSEAKTVVGRAKALLTSKVGGRKDNHDVLPENFQETEAAQENSSKLIQQPLDSFENDGRTAEFFLGGENGEIDLGSEKVRSFATSVEIRGGADIASFGGESDKIYREMMWDIFTSKESEIEIPAAAHQDFTQFLKAQLQLKAKEKKNFYQGQLKSASAKFDITGKESLGASTQIRLSSDMVSILNTVHSAELRKDPIAQERIGAWALHILAKKPGFVPSSVSFKQDGLVALGKMTIQLLSSKQGSEGNLNFNTRQEIDSEKVIGLDSSSFGSFGSFQKSVVKSEDLFRDEAFRETMQSLQDADIFEASADTVASALSEMLRDEKTQQQDEIASDILHGLVEASQELFSRQKVSLESSRPTTQSGNEKLQRSTQHVRFRDEDLVERKSVPEIRERHANVLVEQSDKKERLAKFREQRTF